MDGTSSFICTVCKQRDAEEFCCCSFPCIPLCAPCEQFHSKGVSGDMHLYAPLHMLPASLQDLSTIRKRLLSLNEGKIHLNCVILSISSYQEKLRSCKAALIQQVSNYLDDQLESLDKLRNLLEGQVNAAYEAARAQLSAQEVQGNDVTALLWTFSHIQNQSCLDLFTASFDRVPDVEEVFKGIHWTSKLFSTGQVDYSSLLPLNPVLMQLNETLSVCKVPLNVASPALLRLNRLLDQSDQQTAIDLALSRLITYIQDAQSDKIIPALKAVSICSFTPENLADWNSLEFLLTQEHRISAVDLEVLGSDLKAYCSSHQLAEVRSDHLRLFDCIGQRWESVIALATTIPVDSLSSSTFLPNGQLFVCGGEDSSNAYQVTVNSGLVIQLCSMGSSRQAAGLQLYYSVIYVFGGIFGQSLNSCEQYSLRYGNWAFLPQPMITARSHFIPCLHKHLIYLCGGNSYQSEIFNPQTNSFTPMKCYLPEAKGCRTVFREDRLIVISYEFVSLKTAESSKYTIQKKKEKFRSRGQYSTSVLLGSCVWMTSWNPPGTVHCFDLDTLKLASVVSYE